MAKNSVNQKSSLCHMHITKSLGQIRNHNTVIKKEKKNGASRREQNPTASDALLQTRTRGHRTQAYQDRKLEPTTVTSDATCKGGSDLPHKDIRRNPLLGWQSRGAAAKGIVQESHCAVPREEKQLVAALGTTQCGRRREPDGRGRGTDLTGTGLHTKRR